MIRITIQRLPGLNTSTRRRHWSVQHKEAEAWKWLIWAAMRGKIPKRPYRVCRLVLTRHSSRQPDYGNTVASFKGIEDALKKIGVIADDAPDNFVGGHPDYQWEKSKKGYVTIEVEDATEQGRT